ncbi:hypothetical protein L204_105678 [Cryptococcus depauperatus]
MSSGLVGSTSSSSDEPLLINPPVSALRSSRLTKRGRPYGAAISSSRTTKKKNHSTSSDADDDPIFVGSSIKSSLGIGSEKYMLREDVRPARRRRISRPAEEPKVHSSKDEMKSISSESSNASVSRPRSKMLNRYPLAPDLGLEPTPVPGWLGSATVLIQLELCPVCKVRWKGKESGATRWKHISICRPPLYRPPNSPPDLQQLIHVALSAKKGDTSLFALHIRSVSLEHGVVDGLYDGKDPSTKQKFGSKKKKNIPMSLSGLVSVTDVKPSGERGDSWHEEVRARVSEWIGPPSSPIISASIQKTASPACSLVASNELRLSDAEEGVFPLTQPLTESTLAREYSKLVPTPSPLLPSPPYVQDRSSPPSFHSSSGGILVPASDDEGDSIIQIVSPPSKIPNRHDSIFEDNNGKGNNYKKINTAAGTSHFGGLEIRDGAGDARIMENHPFSCHPVAGNIESKDTNLVEDDYCLLSDCESAVFERDISAAFSDLSLVADDGWLLQYNSFSPQNNFNQRLETEDERCASNHSEDSEDAINWETNEQVFEGSMNHELEDEGLEELIARGMPNYALWDMKRLKRLVVDHGYRAVNSRSLLVDQASQCWKALNPPTSVAGKIQKDSTSMIHDSHDFAVQANQSDDQSNQFTRTSKTKGNKVESEASLNDQFHDMIMKDKDLWVRILRYEPISFDEIVSKAIAAGVSKKGWKKALKRYLDLQGVTYYTEDPTTQRSRH